MILAVLIYIYIYISIYSKIPHTNSGGSNIAVLGSRGSDVGLGRSGGSVSRSSHLNGRV